MHSSRLAIETWPVVDVERLHTGQRKSLRSSRKLPHLIKCYYFAPANSNFTTSPLFILCILWHGTPLWCQIHLNLVSLKIFSSLYFLVFWEYYSSQWNNQCCWSKIYNIKYFRTKENAFLFSIRRCHDVSNIIMRLVFYYLFLP